MSKGQNRLTSQIYENYFETDNTHGVLQSVRYFFNAFNVSLYDGLFAGAALEVI